MTISDDEFDLRMLESLTEESEQPLQWFWMSFAQNNKCVGIILTKQHGPMHATRATHRMKINPGGDIMFIPYDDRIKNEAARELVEQHANKLLTIEEAQRLDVVLMAMN